MKNNLFALILGGAVLASVALAADTPATTAAPDALAARIARVEAGLMPPAVIKGAPGPGWTIANRTAALKVPGVSVAVINGGKVEWTRGYGVARAGEDAPVTPDTLFQAASISKSLAAVAALTLVDAGKLTLDGDVNATLTSWKIPATQIPGAEAVTLRRLLSHTAGLTVHGFAGYEAGKPVPTLLQVLNGTPPANSEPIRLELPPGRMWRYSGGGYCVVQQLALDVVGGTFPDLMRAQVLAPAHMDASTYEQPLPATLAPRAAAGHLPDGQRVKGDAHTYPEMAAAGLWTTAGDLARFALALQHTIEGHDGLVSPATAKEMLKIQFPDSGYGLGVGVEGEGEKLMTTHGGANEGFRCIFVGYPFAGRGAVVMTNSDNGSPLGEEILRAIAQEYDWPHHRVIEKAVVPLTSVGFSSFVGRYERLDTTLLVFRDHERFFAKFGERTRVELFPHSNHEFFTLNAPELWSFERDERGDVSHLIIRASPPQLYRRVR